MMVETSRRARRSNQSVRNEEVYIHVLVFRLFPRFRGFLYLFSISSVVELLRLPDMLILVLLVLLSLFLISYVVELLKLLDALVLVL
jgi:hypothetical protein